MVYHGARKEPGNGAPGPVTIKATGLGGDGEAVKVAAAKEGVTLEHTSYDGWLEARSQSSLGATHESDCR